MASGKLDLDSLTDEQFIKLVQIKDKSNGKLTFVPNQAVSPGMFNVGGKPTAGFSNVHLQFSDIDGAKFAAEVLEMLAS